VIHIDWLSVSQRHVDAPDWGAFRRVDLDAQTGELRSERIVGDTVQASWDTSLRVRSAGGVVEVSGNPSKWGRLDAVCGISDLWQCIEIYNEVLTVLGLPVFERRGEWVEIERNGEGGERHVDGPVVTRVDLTRNLIVGRAGVSGYLDWLEGQRWGLRLPFHRLASSTVSAGRRDRRQRVAYDKARELAANLTKWKRSRSLERDGAVEYLSQLIDWAESVGLVRDEIRLGRKMLRETKYRCAENWVAGTATELFSECDDIKTLEAGAMSGYGHEIFDRLVVHDIGPRLAGQISGRVGLWLNGQDWRVGLSKAAMYRYAGLARKHCGLDMLRPCNVRSLAVSVRPKVLEARELGASDLPSWYQFPARKAA
jgi:hypothetical protein